MCGAGFGGLTFCQALACAKADITLVDRRNHRLFQPLLYQVVTAGFVRTRDRSTGPFHTAQTTERDRVTGQYNRV